MAANTIVDLRDAAQSLDSALRRAKFSIPAAPRRLIRRADLVAKLDSLTDLDGNRAGVTVVSAPVGAGKTTLVASAARERDPRAVAWCSLDASDNDPHSFAASVLEAILASEWSDGLRPMVGNANARGDALDEAMRVVAYGAPLLLVLDECQHIGLDAKHATIGRLVRQAPPTLSIVLITDHDVYLSTRGLGRFHALRTADLAFDVDDVTALFEREGLDVSEETADTITAWTEGRASAVALALAAYRDPRDRERIVASALRAESAAHVLLFERVLQRLSPEHRSVLLASSVSDVVCGDLAIAVADVVDAPALLVDLARADVFFDAVPGCNGWYQHRHPSRELLAAALRHERRGNTSELHRAAARWFAKTDHPDRALRSAIQGSDSELVLELVRDRWIAAAIDEIDPVLGVVPSRDPGSVVSADGARVEAALAVERGERQLAGEWLEAAGDASYGPDAELFEGLLGLRIARDDASAEGIRVACAALEAWAVANRSSAQRRDLLLLVSRARAEACFIDGDLDRARALLEQACTEGVVEGRELQIANATAALAVVTAVTGRVRRAAALVDELGGDAWFSGVDFCRGVRATAHAICAYHSDSLPAAQVLASEARATLRPGVYRDSVLALVRARIASSIGDECGARRLTNRATLNGSPALVATITDALGMPLQSSAEHHDDAHPYARARENVRAAVAQFDARQYSEAWSSLEHALTVAERNGYRRLFLDIGVDVRPLVMAYIPEARALGQVAWHLLQSLPAERSDTSTPVVETLTERELAVLRHLPTMKSNREIAGEMYFSVNTVKTHLKSIYRKLGVNRRRAAVEEARARSLL